MYLVWGPLSFRTRSEAFRARSGGLPARSEDLSARSEGLPARSGGLLTRSEGLPASSEGLPARSEGLPARFEGLPARFEGQIRLPWVTGQGGLAWGLRSLRALNHDLMNSTREGLLFFGSLQNSRVILF